MFRDCLTLWVAFAVSLFALDPSAGAQFTPAPDQTQGQYPAISQGPPDQNAPPPDQTDAAGQADADGGAPPSTPEQDEAADQTHGVARLSVVQGDVNLRRGESGALTAAATNAPLLTGDHLQTADGSRAEVELDAANLLRIGPDSEVGFADVQYQRYGIQLGAGTIIFRVLRSSNAMREIDTPSIGFRPLSEGEFRISVLEDGTTQITARSGQGEIFGPRGAQSVPVGETVLVRGNAGDPEFRNVAEIGRDQLDDWSAHRDAQLLQSRSYQYVSPEIPGADDLDQYGQWVPSQYGQVWTPQNEPAGWSPYSTGEWAWQDYYGWSWVDSAPWGWAPYHYGRWFHNGGYGWCWWPGGGGVRRAFWSPAVVGFFGWGGLGVGIGLGGLGWCALAPFETFHRWWGPGWGARSWGYGGGAWGGRGFRPYVVRNVNITNVYRNAGLRGGAMTAPYNGFGGPHQRFSPATRTQLAGANSFRGGQLPVNPTRSSYLFSNRTVVSNSRLTAASGQRFFQSAQFRQSASVRTVTGNQQASAARSGFGGPATYRSAAPAAHGVAPNMQNGAAMRSGGAVSRSSSNGWQRFGDPGNGGALRQGFAGVGGQSETSGGWHRFGQPRQGTSSAQPYSGANGYRAPSPSSSRPSYTPSYGTPNYSGGGRTNVPVYNGAAQPRYSGPASGSTTRSYSTPGYGSQPRYNSAPAYSAPRSSYGSPSYSAPRSSYNAPSYSAPSGGGGGSHSYRAPSYAAPRSGAPSGGGRSYGGGGGGGGRSSGGGGGGGHSGGGGGGHHR